MASPTKDCRECKRPQPLSRFYVKPSNRDGYDTKCKDCYSKKREAKREQAADRSPPSPENERPPSPPDQLLVEMKSLSSKVELVLQQRLEPLAAIADKVESIAGDVNAGLTDTVRTVLAETLAPFRADLASTQQELRAVATALADHRAYLSTQVLPSFAQAVQRLDESQIMLAKHTGLIAAQ